MRCRNLCTAEAEGTLVRTETACCWCLWKLSQSTVAAPEIKTVAQTSRQAMTRRVLTIWLAADRYIGLKLSFFHDTSGMAGPRRVPARIPLQQGCPAEI